MAREAYRSLYGDLSKLKDTSLLQINGTADDDELWQLLLAVSEWVDKELNRTIYPRNQTLKFDGNGQTSILIPDLVSITSLKEDTTGDQTFDTTWATTDYLLVDPNASPLNHWGNGYIGIRVRTNGTKKAFTEGQENFEIAGTWGYRQFTEASGSLINNAPGYSTSDTSIVVDDSTDFEIGQTIRIGSEQLLIRDIPGGNSLTVTRGMNNTTAASITDDTAINILRWPAPVERAALITTARIWKRAPVFEPFFVDEVAESDVRTMLDPYRRLQV